MLELIFSFTLGEMISLRERNHLSPKHSILSSTVLSPHPQPFSQREKGDPNTTRNSWAGSECFDS